MKIEKIHHVAYRCKDAKQTVEWYGKYLNMDYQLAFAEDHVPSTQAPDPYMHVFLDAGNGNVLAFFELPTQPEMDRDRNTPDWVQHIAFQVATMDEVLEVRKKLEADGIDVIGVTDHTLFKSIYFFDPNGHRLEVTVPVDLPEVNQRLDDVKWDMLNEWAETRRAPKHAEFMHDGTYSHDSE